MVETIKSLRIRIDGFSKLCKGDLSQSRQVQNVIDELLLAKAWLGKALGHLGTPSPYPKDGSRHGLADIEHTAEQANALIMNDLYNEEAGFEAKNAIERVDWLRQAIGETVITTGTLHVKVSDVIMQNIVTHLSEARFWLGFELERMRIDANTPQAG